MGNSDNQILNVIKSRRSHRAYSSEQIKEEELQAILEAAIWAPSANNTQNWHFSVVQKQDILDEIVKTIQTEASNMPDGPFKERIMNPGYHTFYQAPTVIFISGEQGHLAEMNTSLAAQNIMLAAESLNIGSVLVMSHRLAFQGPKGASLLERLSMPKDFELFQAVCLGYKVSQPNPPSRKGDVITYVR